MPYNQVNAASAHPYVYAYQFVLENSFLFKSGCEWVGGHMCGGGAFQSSPLNSFQQLEISIPFSRFITLCWMIFQHLD